MFRSARPVGSIPLHCQTGVDRRRCAPRKLGGGLGQRCQGVARADGRAAVRRWGSVEPALEEGQRLRLERHGRVAVGQPGVHGEGDRHASMRNRRHDEGNRSQRGLSETDNRLITRVTTMAPVRPAPTPAALPRPVSARPEYGYAVWDPRPLPRAKDHAQDADPRGSSGASGTTPRRMAVVGRRAQEGPLQ